MRLSILIMGFLLIVSTPATSSASVIHVGIPLHSVNPFIASDVFSITVVEHIFESFVECDERGEPRPLLADWKVSEDGRVYTFRISKGVRFHDGSVQDSKAVKMNFDFLMKMDPRDLESRAFAGHPFLIDTPAVRLMVSRK